MSLWMPNGDYLGGMPPRISGTGGMTGGSNGGTSYQTVNYGSPQAYSNSDVQRFVYDNAQKYGVGGAQLDGAIGWNPGTANNWAQSNGLAQLGGNSQYGAGDIQRFVYDSAQQYGIGNDQLEQSFGWAPGTVQNWASTNMPVTGSGGMTGGSGSPPPATGTGGMVGGSGSPPPAPGAGVPADAYANNNMAGQQAYNNGTGPQFAPDPNRQQQGPAPTQYGYAQAPGGQRGYYEQQTPVGSFAAANQQWSQGANPVTAQGAQNPYIGQTSQGVQGQGSVLPYAQQIARQGQQANPYLGQQSQQSQGAGANPYAGSNPHLGQMIDQASGDVTRNFNSVIRPRLDSLNRASGSFGNSAVQELEQNAYNDLGKNLGNIASGMRFQDYTTQQGLAESGLNRTQANNQFNSGLNAGDLSRNLAGTFTGQNLGMQGLGQQLGAAQFDAGLGSNTNQFNASLGANDLGRNSSLAQNLGQFNAGQMNSMGQFNANLGQQNSQFNAGQGNNLNQFNTGAANNMLEASRNRGQQMDQFNQGMDFNTWQANVNNMRNGQNDQLNFINSLMGWNNLGLNAANQQRNQPIQDWQTFLNEARLSGGLGGSNNQQLYGNPWLGALGGWNAMGGFKGNGGTQPRSGG